MRTIALATLFLFLAIAAQAEITDAQIAEAIDHGSDTPTKKLWEEIRKSREFRINRAGLDPIEKKVIILGDADRIALESAEAKRQLRQLTVDQVRAGIPLGFLEIVLVSSCYNSTYAGSLPKWGPDGGVHMVLKIGAEIVQPIEKGVGRPDGVSLLPRETGVVSRNGNAVTYTPLYRSALYERSSQRAWFLFPPLSDGVTSFTVTAISGDGKQKEKQVDLRGAHGE